MKIKHLLLPVMAGMASYAMTATAQSVKPAQEMSGKSMTFIENKGQVTDQFHVPRTDIDFKLSGGNGLNIFFGKGKIHYQWAKRQRGTGEVSPLHSGRDDGGMEGSAFGNRGTAEEVEKQYSRPVDMYRMDVELIGANPYPLVIVEDQQAFFERYFLSWVNLDNSNEGVIANTFKKITYKNIYPHIDWIFYFNRLGQLEHDFVVHPGGRVADILMKYSGSSNLKLNADGSLTAHSPMGMITEYAPYSKDLSGNEIASNFLLEDGILSFVVADYTGTLIIDPVLEWGTYFGGSDDETSYALTTDQWGSIYMTGSTGSLSNIATTGAHQTSYGGGTNYLGADAFLSKWNTAGDLLWASYYGGENVDVAKGVGCDTLGNVYFGGYTNSELGIATPGSYQTTLNGWKYDAFVVKVDSSGQRIWSSYFGGSKNEASTSFSLVTDKFDHVYIVGNTQSLDLPVSSGAYQTSLAGGYDVFIGKMDVDGILIWSTYYGGSNDEDAQGICTDTSGNIYITGNTKSLSGIATTNAYQTNNAGGDDAFVSKFDFAGQIIWGSYFGGISLDKGYAITNCNNHIYIGGLTLSNSGIATLGVYQDTFASTTGGDGFLASFDLYGNLVWSTYYGGENPDVITSIWANSLNELYISGETSSSTGISSIDGFQNTFQGAFDIFFAKFNGNGQRQWGSYLGGIDGESNSRLIGDNFSNIYLTGMTSSATNISTQNGFQSALNGGYDALLVRLNDCLAPQLPSSIIGVIEVCAHSNQTYAVNIEPDAINYEWIFPQDWTGNSDSNSINLTIGQSDGIIQVIAFSACGGVSDTQSLAITVLSLPEPIIVNNNYILSTTQSFTAYQWNKNGMPIANATQSIFMVESNGTYTVTVTGNNGCVDTSDTILITDIVGIQELGANKEINIYPNPVQEFINIEASESGHAALLSIEGRMLQSEIKIQKGINTLSLKGLSSGIYFLRFINEKNQKTVMKVIKE